METVIICKKVYNIDITELDLSNYDLIELPLALQYLTQLKKLIVSHNNLTEIPTYIKNLTQL